jgi:membrane protein
MQGSAGMDTRVREAPAFLWSTLVKFFDDDCPGMAAALTFYTFFSLPALLALLLNLVSAVADPAEVRRAIATQVGALIGRAGAEQVQTIVEHAQRSVVDQSAAAVLSVLAVIFGATTAFAQLQGALNRVWEVKPAPGTNQLRDFLAKRVFSFGVVLVVAFLLLVSLALSAGLAAAGDLLTARLGAPAALLEAGNWVVSFVVVAALFAAMFKLLPDAKIGWRDVRVGAAATALLFVLGKTVIGVYLGRTDPGSAYGAAGSLAIVLIWVYYSSMLVLFGAELTRQWTERYGAGVRPERGAVHVVEEEREVRRG